ncbi:MAG TPA: hypothetical protein P5526_28885 [Anaerolineae bacterium]|nr:hypothetical protein [Anaerolineae bacterium]MCB0177800.1 hypothetical protein [Anaerolineae bacterium]MCB0224524.1 hypothetical protein [Anaerolineae bacterium]MCB9103467.1 hypothetical protein [Anaerolineales bacterium]HRV96203.1 hypothetical protein [Anaerolineae bacterium]
MDQELKKKLINRLHQASSQNGPVAIDEDGKLIAVILSASDYQQFQAERDGRLLKLKQEMDAVLALVQSHTRKRSLAEVEARLGALRKIILEEMGE